MSPDPAANVSVAQPNLPTGLARATDGQLIVITIDRLSEELVEHIRGCLVAVCRGPAAADGVPGWDYKSTVRELNTRLRSKSRDIQVGMIGELLTHVLAPLIIPHLSQASVYFNKEERLHKKGFDMTFLEDATSRLWYCEVKSGEIGTLNVAKKSVQLLKAAANDLIEKLTNTERASLWDAAINDAMLVLHDPTLKKAKQLLSTDSDDAQRGADWERHAILTAGVFDHARADIQAVRSALGQLTQLNAGFATEVWLVIQKSTYQAVLDLFTTEATP